VANTQPVEKLDPFDSAFVDALLLLRGVDEPPTLEQFTGALSTLNRFYTALMKAPLARDVEDAEITEDSLYSQAMSYACLYECFGLASFGQATLQQRDAVAQWVANGDLPTKSEMSEKGLGEFNAIFESHQ
jgi:hypothetical protein